MEELLMKLAADARMQEAVAMATLGNGMRVFAYPLESGMLIGLGGVPDSRATGEQVLRKRASDPVRYGGWLPAMFKDNGIYVIRRMTEHGDDMTVLPPDLIAAAEELLSD